MKKTLLTTTLLFTTIAAFGQKDRSKEVETKYLSLPTYNVSTTDPSTVTIEFSMKEGVFGLERLKEGESTCMPAGGTLKDAVKVKAYHYEIPYTQQESYVVAKAVDGTVLYAIKASEKKESLVRFGWDDKMKQAQCEYALFSDKLKKEYASSGNSFKASEHNKYENEVFTKAGADAKANVSLSYIEQKFDVYSAKGKVYNYDDLDAAFDKAMTAYGSIGKNGFSKNDLSLLKEAIAIWEKELGSIDLEDKNARISEDVAKGLHENCMRAYLYTYDFEKAKEHAEAFLKIFGNLSTNRTEIVKQVLLHIHMQQNGAEQNATLITDIAALHAKASAKGANPQVKIVSSSEFDRLQSEFYKFKGNQAIGINEEKKAEEAEMIANGELNPYQKWYYATGINGEGIYITMPPSALSGVPEMTEFPKEMCTFTSAESITVLKNKIASIPSDISNLSGLKKLDLSGNQLTTLPVEIGQLVNLETLKLNDNPIESIPAEIENCTKLTTLHIKGTKLTTAQIAEIQKLLPDCKIKL